MQIWCILTEQRFSDHNIMQLTEPKIFWGP